MNKLFSKIAALSVGLAMAIGVGVSIGGNTSRAVRAATASFTPSDFSGQGTSGTGGDISATVSGVTFACDKGYGGTQIRCYKNSKITISSENTITDISFTFSSDSYTGGLSASYTGLSTTSWEQTLSSQARITAATVTYTTSGETTTYTVTYDANGGTVTPASEEIVENGNPSLPTPEYSGYDFDGWQVNGEGEYVTSSYTVTADVTMVAHWTEKEPTVDYPLITDLAKASQVVITTTANSVNYYMPAATTTNSVPTAETCQIEDDVLKGVEASNLFTVTLTEGKYVFKNADGNYLYTINDNSGLRISGTEDSYTVTSTSNGCYKMQDTNNSRYVGVYNGKDWRSYGTSGASNYSGSGEAIKFYGIEKDYGALQKIELSGTYKTDFKQGETFTHDGMVVTATYESTDTLDVTSKATWSGYDLSSSGEQTVTVSYTDNEVTKSATYKINVKASAILTAEDVTLEVGDEDYTPVVKIQSTSKVIEGCTFTSSDTDVATVINGKIHAVARGEATITAAHADDASATYTSATFKVTVRDIETIESIYSKSASTVTEFYGYYVGEYADGAVVMDGEYGILLYKTSADTAWVVDETVLYVKGSISIYKNLYEVSASNIDVVTESNEINRISKPVNYSLSGSESADNPEVANRRTFVSGTLTSVTESSGSYNVVIGEHSLYLKYSDNKEITLKDETTTTISAYLNSMIDKNVTIKGFTSFFTNFQVRVYDIVEQDDSYTAEAFAQQLLDETDAVCSVWDGKSSNKEALTSIWNHLGGEERWQALNPTEQAKFTDYANPDYENTSEDVLAKAAGRYDMLCKKYFQTSNFANRDFSNAPVQPESVRFGLNESDLQDNTMIIIVAIAATSAIAFSALLILKKKKHNR